MLGGSLSNQSVSQETNGKWHVIAKRNIKYLFFISLYLKRKVKTKIEQTLLEVHQTVAGSDFRIYSEILHVIDGEENGPTDIYSQSTHPDLRQECAGDLVTDFKVSKPQVLHVGQPEGTVTRIVDVVGSSYCRIGAGNPGAICIERILPVPPVLKHIIR